MLKIKHVSLQELRGIGKQRLEIYKRLGVETVYELLRYYPRSYIDFSRPIQISQAMIGDAVALRVWIDKKHRPWSSKQGVTIMKADAHDASGKIFIQFFNNQYAFNALEQGREYLLYGKIQGNGVGKAICSPVFFSAQQEVGMQPVYSLTEGLTSQMIRTNMKQCLERLDAEGTADPLPISIREAYRLLGFREALHIIHFPHSLRQLEEARRRLVFEELLSWQMGLAAIKEEKVRRTSVRLRDVDLAPFFHALPFQLTDAQLKVIDECASDCKRDQAMHRLVQGDVGSGKTMVAAAMAFLICKNGYQAAMMVPTEVLAVQHYQNLSTLLSPLSIRVGCLTGSLSKKKKDCMKEELANGKLDFIIGTHALVQQTTYFQSLGLVITDEQHRFGVLQREALENKGKNPHTMVMSATPIPRTLALIVYGDLDVSVIDALPQGRQKVATYAIDPTKRKRALRFIRDALDAGRQAYIICPTIDQGERDSAAAIPYAKALEKAFKNYTVGLMHSKLNDEEKNSVMHAFQKGDIQLLVSTTVVEVGVDVPNAVVMMIENAELFGLSQLHQLRGRVGRGQHLSTCVLVSNLAHVEGRTRLKILCDTHDGFRIAEKDLQLRGPGDFFGSRQHGLPAFRIADITKDMQILHTTRSLAVERIVEDPKLLCPDNRGLRFLVEELFSDKFSVL